MRETELLKIRNEPSSYYIKPMKNTISTKYRNGDRSDIYILSIPMICNAKHIFQKHQKNAFILKQRSKSNLKELCKRRRLSTQGRKRKLIKRLI